jgi:hypothetical protein
LVSAPIVFHDEPFRIATEGGHLEFCTALVQQCEQGKEVLAEKSGRTGQADPSAGNRHTSPQEIPIQAREILGQKLPQRC